MIDSASSSGQSSNPPVLDWEGSFNARDLGGLRTTDGRLTRTGAVVRSAHLDRLSASGWQALHDHGIRTILDLRDENERDEWREPPVTGITSVHFEIDDVADEEFWNEMW